jgi:hypothetical protein
MTWTSSIRALSLELSLHFLLVLLLLMVWTTASALFSRRYLFLLRCSFFLRRSPSLLLCSLFILAVFALNHSLWSVPSCPYLSLRLLFVAWPFLSPCFNVILRLFRTASIVLRAWLPCRSCHFSSESCISFPCLFVLLS